MTSTAFCIWNFFQAIFLHMIRVLFTALSKDLTSSTGFLLAFEVPQGYWDILLNPLRTIADIHLFGSTLLVKFHDVGVGLYLFFAFSNGVPSNICYSMFSLGCTRGVIVNAMNGGIVVSEFEIQSHYYVHFQTNPLGKGMDPLSSQLWVKWYHYCYSWRIDVILSKETNSNLFLRTVDISSGLANCLLLITPLKVLSFSSGYDLHFVV